MTPAPIEARFEGRLGAFRLDADFTLPARGITALSGPSGAGKTTLLRCIAGLSRMAGRLVVEGDVWQDVRTFRPAHRRPVGLVFQDASLLPHLSVRENLEYGARRAAPGPIGLDETVDLLGLETLLARRPANLSGGERQRVALGRALLTQPRLLLMDEPLSSLDAGAKAEILPYLERLHAGLAIPVLYVTHDAREIDRLADHVLVMRDGRVTPAEAQPAQIDQARARRDLKRISAAERDRLALAALIAGLPPV